MPEAVYPEEHMNLKVDNFFNIIFPMQISSLNGSLNLANLGFDL